MFIRFDVINERDRQTDGRTLHDSIDRACIASRGKNRTVFASYAQIKKGPVFLTHSVFAVQNSLFSPKYIMGTTSFERCG